MSSLNGVLQRFFSKKLKVGQSIVDGDIALRLKYIGSGSVTSVTVTTATDITMVTSDGGTDAYTWAAFGTMGALVDAINKDGIFQAKILDGLRSEVAAASRFKDGAIVAAWDGSEMAFDMKFDTNTIAPRRMAVRLSADRTFGTSTKLADGHRVILSEIVSSFVLGGGADALAMKIYECTPTSRGSIETLLLERTPVTGSVATLNWAGGNGGISANEGNDLVVIVTDGTSFGASDYMTVAGIVE